MQVIISSHQSCIYRDITDILLTSDLCGTQGTYSSVPSRLSRRSRGLAGHNARAVYSQICRDERGPRTSDQVQMTHFVMVVHNSRTRHLTLSFESYAILRTKADGPIIMGLERIDPGPITRTGTTARDARFLSIDSRTRFQIYHRRCLRKSPLLPRHREGDRHTYVCLMHIQRYIIQFLVLAWNNVHDLINIGNETIPLPRHNLFPVAWGATSSTYHVHAEQAEPRTEPKCYISLFAYYECGGGSYRMLMPDGLPHAIQLGPLRRAL